MSVALRSRVRASFWASSPLLRGAAQVPHSLPLPSRRHSFRGRFENAQQMMPGPPPSPPSPVAAARGRRLRVRQRARCVPLARRSRRQRQPVPRRRLRTPHVPPRPPPAADALMRPPRPLLREQFGRAFRYAPRGSAPYRASDLADPRSCVGWRLSPRLRRAVWHWSPRPQRGVRC